LMRPILFFVWWRVNILYENLDLLFLFFLIVFKVLNHMKKNGFGKFTHCELGQGSSVIKAVKILFQSMR